MTSVLTNTSQSDVCQNVGALKSTDVGEIPVDWQVAEAGDIGRFKGGSGFPLTYQGQQHGEHPFFKVSDMSSPDNTIALKRAIHYISDNARRALGAYLFPKNTIVFAKVGAAIFLERKRMLEQPSCIDNNMAGFVVSSPDVEFRYIYHFLTSYKLGSLVSVTALPSLNGGVLKRIKVPLPPKAEQALVAEALDDADALIESLEQLIAKKRAVKQGAMQDLLSGRRRLPGFGAEWQEVKFGAFASLRKERIDPRVAGRQPFCVELEHVGQGTGRLEGFSEAGENSSLKAVFKEGDVLFGKLRAYLRKYWLADREGVCSTEFWVLIPQGGKVTSTYLYQLVQTDAFVEVASLGYGTHMPRSDWSSVNEIEFSIPQIDEQEAIGRVLGDMDAELDALELRLQKARQIKQGMMQELLTGRVRLV